MLRHEGVLANDDPRPAAADASGAKGKQVGPVAGGDAAGIAPEPQDAASSTSWSHRRHESRYAPRGWADVVDLTAARHADAGTAVPSGRIQQSGHQDPVGVEKVGFAGRVPLPISVVGTDGVAGLLDVLWRGDDRFAVENRRDLLRAEEVAFNGQRAVDRFCDHDTPVFAVASLRRWWEEMGKSRHPSELASQGEGTSAREAWRRFLHGTIQPIADQIAVECSTKLGTEITISFDKLFASDLSGRARAFQSMVGGGMDATKAAGLAGVLPD